MSETPLVDKVENNILAKDGDISMATLAAVTYARRLERDRAELIEALRDCCDAIDEEVNAAAGDEHPVIEAHAKASKKARALLARIEKE